MRIGVPKEIKNNEDRVSLTPAGVHLLCAAGHHVWIEAGAGEGSGFADADYAAEGAEIAEHADQVWSSADLVIKVKEPLPEEYPYFRSDLILFTYLHLAANLDLAQAFTESKITAVAYETIQFANGTLPLLIPMSEVAGRMSVQIGAQLLERLYGGRGILLGGVPGVLPAEVVIIGGGIVGTNAAKMALGLGASVIIIDRSAARLRYLDDIFYGRIRTLMSNPFNVASAVEKADLLIGAVLIPGAKAPRIVSEQMVQNMRAGAVIVDVAIDQGGSIETIDHPTTHSEPTYNKYGVVHYAVANIPGSVPRSSTLALTNATLPYIASIANLGLEAAIQKHAELLQGVNTFAGSITHAAVAESLQLAYSRFTDMIGSSLS